MKKKEKPHPRPDRKQNENAMEPGGIGRFFEK